jgi:hypothetical protein
MQGTAPEKTNQTQHVPTTKWNSKTAERRFRPQNWCWCQPKSPTNCQISPPSSVTHLPPWFPLDSVHGHWGRIGCSTKHTNGNPWIHQCHAEPQRSSSPWTSTKCQPTPGESYLALKGHFFKESSRMRRQSLTLRREALCIHNTSERKRGLLTQAHGNHLRRRHRTHSQQPNMTKYVNIGHGMPTTTLRIHHPILWFRLWIIIIIIIIIISSSSSSSRNVRTYYLLLLLLEEY